MTAAARRRGTAPLELVLVFPFLLLLMVCGWWAASGGIAKTAATADARYAAWAKRPAADPQRPFGVLVQKPDGSLVEADAHRKLSRRPPIATTAPTLRQADAHAATTDRPWDFEEESTRFDPTRKPMLHHKDELKQVGKFVPLVGRFAPHLATARQLDLMANPEFAAERAKGAEWAVRRPTALRGMLSALGPMAAALYQTVQASIAAAEAFLFPLAAYLAYEAALIARGMDAVVWLNVNAVAPDAPSGRGELPAREEGSRTRRLSPAQEQKLLSALDVTPVPQ